MKWTTKEGKKIEICDMETSHIQNCLSLLRRNGVISTTELLSYFSSPPNGEMAEGLKWLVDYIPEEMRESLKVLPCPPIIKELLGER